MTNSYRDSEEVKLFCGMVDALALLPTGDLPEALHFLEDSTPEGMEPLLDYFKRTYCTGTFRRVECPAPNGENVIIRRTPPLFPPAMWNVHQVTLEGEQWTNNLCEAWNHRIEQLCGVQHPSIWKLIWWLKRDAALSSTHILSNSRGDPPRRRIKRVYCQLQARLRQLCCDRQDGSKSVEEFLRGAGHNIRWKPGPGNDIHWNVICLFVSHLFL